MTAQAGSGAVILRVDHAVHRGRQHLHGVLAKRGTPARWQVAGRVHHGGTADTNRSSILAGDRLRELLDDWRNAQDPRAPRDASVAAVAEEILRRKPFNPRDRAHALWHLRTWAREDLAADGHELSAMYHDAGLEVFGYGDSVIREGYGRLAEKMARGLPIEFGQVVRKIRYGLTRAEGVRIYTETGKYAVKPLVADAVIVTLPLAVLKQAPGSKAGVVFDPPLPEAKVAAIKALGVGYLAKLGFRFPPPAEIWWPKDQYVFGRLHASEREAGRQPNIIVNAWVSHRKPMLILLVGGPAGREVEQMRKAEAKRWAWDRLKESFGREIAARKVRVPGLSDFFRTDWSQDRFALGAYSFMKVGALPDNVLELGKPCGSTVYFAGEATSVQFRATTHGAYLSGQRAAAEYLGRSAEPLSLGLTENRHFREKRLRAQRFFDLAGNDPACGHLESLVDILKLNRVFGILPRSELKFLARLLGECRVLAEGEELCFAGDEAAELYVVACGELSVLLPAGSHQSQRRDLKFSAGDIAGDFAYFREERRRTATLAARLEGTTVYPLSYAYYTLFLEAFPDATLELYRSTARYLLGRLQLIPESKARSTEQPAGPSI